MKTRQSIIRPDSILKKHNALIQRIELSLMKGSDFLQVSNYIEIINNYKKIKGTKTVVTNKEYNQLLGVLLGFVSNYQLTDSQLQRIRRAVILAGMQKYHEKTFNDMLWWTEARSNTQSSEQLLFLRKQLYSTRQNSALGLLVELGQVDEIKGFIKSTEGISSAVSFELALRRARLVKQVTLKETTASHAVIEEYGQTIGEVIRHQDYQNTDYKQHLLWLIKQLAITRADQASQRVIKNLMNDCLYYNKKSIKGLDETEINELTGLLNQSYMISPNAKVVEINILNSISPD